MRIEDLKRWHWIVIGAIAGLLLGFVYSGLEPAKPGRSISQDDFRGLATRLSQSEATKDQPLVRNVVVYPPEMGAYGKPVHLVRLEWLHHEQGKPGSYAYMPAHMNAEVPFVRNGSNPQNSVIDFLAQAKQQNPKLDYRMAWERNPTTLYAMTTIGGVVLIGGVWPTLVGLLVGAGLGRAPDPKAGYDLDRFGKFDAKDEAEALGVVNEKKTVSEDEKAELDAMVRKLEQSVGGGGVSGASAASDSPHQHEPIRQLSNKPLETATPVARTPEEEKEFAGEYYPVARPKHHEKD